MEKLRTITVRLDGQTAARLQAMQSEKRVSISDVIRDCINNEHNELFETVRQLKLNNSDMVALLKEFLPHVATKKDIRESTNSNTRGVELFHKQTVAELTKIFRNHTG